MKTTRKQNNRPPYLIGILCLLPLLGAFVGIALILYGIFRYKDKLLVVIGSFGVILTIALYSILFYNLKYGKATARMYARITQNDLNSLAKTIEAYKFQNGSYPDSLEQLTKFNEAIVITDPLLTRKMSRSIKITFCYQRFDQKYTLYSVGIDGIPHTSDDIYPILGGDSSKFGLIRSK